VLLNIFRYYLDASPRFWPRLVHICRKWRRIVFASQRHLHLRLICTHGTPVLESLDLWPTLPIVVQYGGSQELDPGDEDNIMAALKRFDRVSSISLTVTSSLLERLSTIEKTFWWLEDLVLQSQVGVWLTLPSTFRWGPRLRRLHLTRISFPSLPWLLLSSKKLVDVQLHDYACEAFWFSQGVLAYALSGMSELRTLLLDFRPTTSFEFIDAPTQPVERFFIPTLTCLKYRGISKYLDTLMARIDAPRLTGIEVTFFGEAMFVLSSIRNSIRMQKSYQQADILFSERSVSISLTQPTPMYLKFQVFCESFSQQLLSITAICSQISTSLSCVNELRVKVMRQPSRQDDPEQWLRLIRSFRGIKWCNVTGNSPDFVLALCCWKSDQRREAVLPALQKLYISQPGPRHEPLREAVVTFMTSRQLSGHPIVVEYERLCHMSDLRGKGTTYSASVITTR
jgi:hypothetical protein